MRKQYRDQDFLIKVGARLVKIREQKGVTQERLAELTERFDSREIGRIERAETNASISKMKLIADALKVNISELLE